MCKNVLLVIFFSMWIFFSISKGNKIHFLEEHLKNGLGLWFRKRRKQCGVIYSITQQDKCK